MLESHWCWQGTAEEHGDELILSADYDAGWGPVLEVSSLSASPRPDEPASDERLEGGRDFEGLLVAIKDGAAVTGESAAAAFNEVILDRERAYTRPLGSGLRMYRAVALVEGVLLTRPLRVAGVKVFPLGPSARGEDIPALLNGLLEELGYMGRLDQASWAGEYARRRPMAVYVADRVDADSLQDATVAMNENVALLAALLSIQRGAGATVLGGLVESLDDAADAGAWINASLYIGNRIGGFISGESQTDTYRRFAAITRDSRLHLWLTLHRDALAEDRWDFRFFRHFNLLEAMALEFFGQSTPVEDWSGATIVIQGKPATTQSARGKVYALLRHGAKAIGVAERSWCVAPETSAWNDVGVWVAIRDAVAHDGGLRPDAGDRIRSARILPERFATVTSPAGPPEQQYLRAVAEASTFLVLALLDGRIAPPDKTSWPNDLTVEALDLDP